MSFERFSLSPVNLEATNLADEWKFWLDAFDNYRIATKLDKESDDVQKATLLHLAGTGVQRLLSGLPGENKKFEEVKQALSAHFQPKRNKWAERHKFRKRAQLQHESLDTFIAELRMLSLTCDFGEANDDNILGQVIEKCSDGYLREKLLQQGETLTLEKAQTLGRAIESAKKDTQLLGGHGAQNVPGKSDVNAVRFSVNKAKEKACFRCGKTDHLANNERCKARNAQCIKCKKTGHFWKYCRSRESENKEDVKFVQPVQHQSDKSNPEYVLYTTNNEGLGVETDVEINGKLVQMMIDTGCAKTLIPKQWFRNNLNIPLNPTNVKFSAFGGGDLKCLGVFDAKLRCNKMEVMEPVYVIDVEGPPLLGRSALSTLNLVKIHAVGESPTKAREKIYQEYENLFKEELGDFKNYEYKIKINSDVPPKVQKQRPVPAPLEDRLKQEIERMIQEDVIEEATGASWISPVQIVYKGNGELRVCVDLREANKAVIRERFPIPRIQDLLRQLSGARMFSTLDLRKAYWQVRLAKESREITSFIAAGKVYQFKRLPFGLASAPEVYQRVMSIVCEGLSGVLSYFDDVVVYGSTPEEHWKNLRAVMAKLQDCGLRLNADKCALGMCELKFLGHVISAEGIKPDPDKVKAIADAPVPQNQAELRSFLGSITYLTQFVSNLATVITPLRYLTQKGVVWKWSTTESNAFEEVKELLIKAPCLAHYSLEAETKLVVDASPVGLGCVLLQNVDSRWQPISYASRSLTAAEKRYSQIEREAMAVLFGLQKMHSYIYGRHVVVSTDHKPLLGVFNKNTQSIRLERIALRCQDYDFTLTYEPGSENIADGLSRLPLNATVTETSFVEEHVHFVKSADALLSIDEIKEAGESDPELLEVVKVLDGTQNLVNNKWKHFKDELSFAQGLLWRGRRIYVPEKLRKKALTLAHEAHQGIVRCKQRLRRILFWPGMDSDVEDYCRNCETCVRLQPLRRDTPNTATPLPDYCWEKCALDLVGPFPGEIYIMTVVDYRSKWPEAIVLKRITSESIVTALADIFARFGNPKVLITDNGRQFVAEEFQDFMKANGIQHRRVSPYFPQANGQVERFHRYLKHSIRAAELDGLSWTEVLPTILQVYRSTPHAGTNMTPAKLFLNREITTKLPTVPEMDQNNPEERYKEYQRKLCEYTDAKRHAQQHNLVPGDIVFVANTKSGKLIPTFGHQKYVIVRCKGPDTFELVNAETGQHLTRNVKFLSRVPRMELPVKDDNDNGCLESEEFAGAAMPPLDQLGSTVSDDRNPADSGPPDSAMELRRSTRTPKPKRDPDFVYD